MRNVQSQCIRYRLRGVEDGLRVDIGAHVDACRREAGDEVIVPIRTIIYHQVYVDDVNSFDLPRHHQEAFLHIRDHFEHEVGASDAGVLKVQQSHGNSEGLCNRDGVGQNWQGSFDEISDFHLLYVLFIFVVEIRCNVPAL